MLTKDDFPEPLRRFVEIDGDRARFCYAGALGYAEARIDIAAACVNMKTMRAELNESRQVLGTALNQWDIYCAERRRQHEAERQKTAA